MNNQYADSVPTPSLDSEAAAIAGFLTPELADAFALVASGAEEPGDLERLLDLLRAAGANGIRIDKPLADIYTDILVIGQHASNTPGPQAINLGKMMLGVQD